MNTFKTVSLSLALVFASVTPAFAQYYPTATAPAYSGTCVNITSNLSYNSRGAQVSSLQSFLVSQNFPGGGSWMITGYFGGATEQAVKDLQQERGLPVSGIVDVATRAAIEQMSCGGNVIPPSYVTYPTSPTYPATPYTYPNYPYGNGTTLNITTLSQNTGFPGQTVTIYGTGFDPSNNVVNFGNQSIPGISSSGTSLTFTIPSTTYGLTSYSGTVLNLSVSDSRGTSNTLSFTLYGGSTCGSNYFYAYGSCSCNYSYPNTINPFNGGSCGNNQYNPGNTLAPTLSYLNPTSGAVGTSVTIFGSGFTSTNNSIHFGNGVIANLPSQDGQSLSFTVPSMLTGYGSQNVGLGSYPVSVTNGNGYATGAISFTVTALNTSGNLSIASVSAPSTLAINQTGTWTIVVTNPNGGTVTVSPTWGDANIYPYNGTVIPQTTYAQGQTTLTFTHSYATSGTYTITFTANNSNGGQAFASATVSVAGNGVVSGSVPTISYLSPSSGYVGQQVTIYGTNFVGTNTVNFGNGAIQNVYGNGNTLTFTVPSSVAPYCTPGLLCAQYIQQITPGTYNVSVMDQYGTSNSTSFIVQ